MVGRLGLAMIPEHMLGQADYLRNYAITRPGWWETGEKLIEQAKQRALREARENIFNRFRSQTDISKVDFTNKWLAELSSLNSLVKTHTNNLNTIDREDLDWAFWDCKDRLTFEATQIRLKMGDLLKEKIKALKELNDSLREEAKRTEREVMGYA